MATAHSPGKRRSRWWTIIVGCGLALSPVHNLWLTNLATNAEGETLFFLPAFGYLLILMGSGLFLLHNWNDVRRIGWGDRRIVVPLLIIVAVIGVSGITADSLQGKLAPLGMGVALFTVYLMTRVVGRDVFLPLAVGAGVTSAGVIAASIQNPGMLTGGLVFEWNYDIVVGFVLLGTALLLGRWRLYLLSLSLVAMFLSGSPEAIFSVVVVGVVVLVRRDWSKKLVLVLAPVVVVAAVWFGLGYGQQLYSYTLAVAQNTPTVPPTLGNVPVAGVNVSAEKPLPEVKNPELGAIEYRLSVIRDTLTNLKPLGEGYNLTNFSKVANVHNVPLVIVQQLGWPGMLAGLAWLWVTVWCLVKTRWKYVWVLVLALSIWDHYVFTQLAPVWWAVVGVTSASDNIKTDLLFRSPKLL
jgi:hypothetical protein